MEDTNELIAEFMGMQDTDLGWYDSEDVMSEYACQMVGGNTFEVLQYDRSWDWLMPVVEKIESDERYDVDIMQYGTRISDNQKEIVNNIANISFDKKIDHTYQAVVEFIKQQNKNK